MHINVIHIIVINTYAYYSVANYAKESSVDDWLQFDSTCYCTVRLNVIVFGLMTVCNVTLDAAELRISSSLRYGQIKSLEMRDNQICWFRFVPEIGFRIELQIYRLVDMGVLNQTRYYLPHLYLNWVILTN